MWLVYQAEGEHVGPVTTELLVRGLATGRVPRDARVAPAGTTRWQPVMTIGELAAALDALDLEKGLEPAATSAAPSPAPLPEPTASEADATEVIRRDETLQYALNRGRGTATSSPPPKPPTPPRTTTAPPPPHRPSARMGSVPSKPAMLAVPVTPQVTAHLRWRPSRTG